MSNALETLERIIDNPNLYTYDFRYCFVGEDKIPYTYKGTRAKPNAKEDFCSLDELSTSDKILKYAGIGISIIESHISAIDVDKCFSIPFDINSGDERAKDIIELFKDKAYIEFSFSGKGLRILFKIPEIPNYANTYYIKNDKTKVEFYQPYGTARYVTITGRVIFDNSLSKMTNLDTVYLFLNKYMVRPKTFASKPENDIISKNNDLSLDDLMKKVKSLYLTDITFQDLWFMTAEEHFTKLYCHIPGKSLESNADFHLLSILYTKIVTDKEKLRKVFEMSDYFKNKDKKHLNKWTYNNYRYYNYVYERLG